MKKFLVFVFLCSALFANKVRIYEEATPETPIYQTSDYDEITAILNGIGVRFEKWEANRELSGEEEVIEAYREDVDRLMAENGYKSVDVVRIFPDSPIKEQARKKFLNEHSHSEDEVRFFVEGSGLFYLHVGGKVYIVLCEKGDLISIPARYTHWFDMGKDPYFTAIRFFIEPSGWVADFTGNPIADSFPKYGD